MFQAFIITLREGVEAALIVGITLSYLAKIGHSELRKYVYWALAAGFAASIGCAIALSAAKFNPELFEGAVMLVASFFVVTMVVFMARAAKTLKKNIESKVGGFAGAGSRLGLFLFVFLMVLREGVETVLILSAVSLTTENLLSLLGTVTGVALSVVFGVMFVKGSIRIDLRRFFKVTTVILMFVAAQLLISGLHELGEGGYFPANKTSMSLIGPIVRNDIFFFITIVAFAALMVLFEYRRRQPEAVETASRAEARKAQWTVRRERIWMSAVYISSFVFIVLVTAEFIYAKGKTALTPATQVEFVDGVARIDAAGMQKGALNRYSGTINGKAVNFLVYRKPDGTLATVLDACAICGAAGFYNSGAQGITCKNCNAPVNPQTVGEGGGCNPIPLAASIEHDVVSVTQRDLASSAAKVKE